MVIGKNGQANFAEKSIINNNQNEKNNYCINVGTGGCECSFSIIA